MFHAPPPRFGGAGEGGELTWPPPPEKILGGRAPPKGRCFDFLRGAKRAIFAPKSGQKWPNFPARAKGARGIPQRAYNSLQIGSNLRKNGSKTQKLLQKCPWWRKSVHIASKTLKTTPKYVKTALRAPKARAKNFPKTCPPPRIFIWGRARPPRWRDPYMKHCEIQCVLDRLSRSQNLAVPQNQKHFFLMCKVRLLREKSFGDARYRNRFSVYFGQNRHGVLAEIHCVLHRLSRSQNLAVPQNQKHFFLNV